jgi:hypothetical protein
MSPFFAKPEFVRRFHDVGGVRLHGGASYGPERFGAVQAPSRCSLDHAGIDVAAGRACTNASSHCLVLRHSRPELPATGLGKIAKSGYLGNGDQEASGFITNSVNSQQFGSSNLGDIVH